MPVNSFGSDMLYTFPRLEMPVVGGINKRWADYADPGNRLEGEVAFQPLLYDLLDIRKQLNEARFGIKYLAYQFVAA